MAKKWRKAGEARLASGRASSDRLRGKQPRLQISEPGVRSRGRPPDLGVLGGFVGYGVELTVAQVNRPGLSSIERARATAAKNGELIAGFIHGAVAVDSFGDSQRREIGRASCRRECGL